MQFADPSKRGQKPVPLKRRLASCQSISRQKPKVETFESLALIISIDDPLDEAEKECPYCLLQMRLPKGVNRTCRKSFNKVHEEAEQIRQQAMKRFDNNLIQV